MISLPRLGRITQGTVFCGAFADHYDDVSVWGVVITARCDTTHNKTPVVNYLPIVKVEDWLKRQGGLLIIERSLADSYGRFKSLLKNKKLSESLLEVYPPSYVAKAHFPEPPESTDPKIIKKNETQIREAKTALTLSGEIEAFRHCLSAGEDQILIEKTIEIYAICRKMAQSVILDLLSHKLSGYYYLQNIGNLTEHPSNIGYVTLLREVRYFPQSSAKCLVDGVPKDKFASKSIEGICFDVFDFACPVAEIKSPWIEHLMQSFCNLFGRVGIEDIDKSHISTIINFILPEE